MMKVTRKNVRNEVLAIANDTDGLFNKLLFEVNNLKSEIELDQNHHGDGALFDNLVAIYEQLAIISEKLGYDINWVRKEYQRNKKRRGQIKWN